MRFVCFGGDHDELAAFFRSLGPDRAVGRGEVVFATQPPTDFFDHDRIDDRELGCCVWRRRLSFSPWQFFRTRTKVDLRARLIDACGALVI